jgi:hypothetical protein
MTPLTRAAGRTLIAAVSALVLIATPALAATPEPLPAHPEVVRHTDENNGRYIKDMVFDGTRLYMGHGNYTFNTGPTELAYVDVVTGVTGVSFTAPTEEINTFRRIDGGIAVPWIDGTGCGACTPPNGGLTTNVGGWRNIHAFPAAHVYDVAQYGNDLYLSGATPAGASIYRSTDGGKTWNLSIAETSSGGKVTGYERFYWMGVAGGKLYAQAAHKDYPSNGGGEMFPLRAWDGTRWTKSRVSLDLINEASNVESFRGVIYTPRYAFTGASRKVAPVGSPFTIVDFYADGDRLYAVSGTGQVAYTAGVTQPGSPTWTLVPGATIPADQQATSIAVNDSHIFVGTRTGIVYRTARTG